MTPNALSTRRPPRRARLLPALAAFLLALSAACNGGREAGGGKEADKPKKPEETQGPPEVKLTPEAVAKYGIRVEQARLRALTPTFIAPGEVAFNAERTSLVGSPVIGRVAELKARVGDEVKKGDELIVLDSPEFAAAQSDHLLKQTAVAVATPQVGLTRSAYERGKKVFDESQGKSMTLTEVQKREGEYRAAEGALLQAQTAAVASRNRLELLGMSADAIRALETSSRISSRFVIRSPLAGQVVERPVTLGELVRPERESLLKVVDLSDVWVLADVPEARLGGLKVGAGARIKTGEEAAPFKGTVSYIPPQLDPATRTAQVRVVAPNEGGGLRAGTFTQVEIEAGRPGDAEVVAIPDEAVITIDGKPSVFVPAEGKENTFVRKVIAVGPAANGLVTVEAGLKPGQPFVSSGTFVLKAELGKSSIED
jgi:cobalt-zinc-cadmium efflux system membrane fusion protein